MTDDLKNPFDSVFPQDQSGKETPAAEEPPVDDAAPADADAAAVSVDVPEVVEPAEPEEDTVEGLAPSLLADADLARDEDTVILPEKRAEPPRIVAETPLGGKVPHLTPSAVDEPAAPAAEVPSLPSAAVDPEAPTAISSRRALDEVPTEPATETPLVAPAPEAEVSTPPSAAAPLPSAEPVAAPDDWDDDISPDLAAVLFGGQPEPASGADTAPAAPAAASTEAATSEPEPTPAPVEQITLTDAAEARSLPLVAEGHSAPAPDAALAGKVRYVRIEEPLDEDEDKGTRIKESWDYFRTGRPSLGGRLVKEVNREEVQYSDGSWVWRYERQYTDRGRDRREVRANTDRTFIERKDEVSALEPETEKRLRFKEQVAMIFAPPEQEEKRGLLGSLFGRDEEAEGPAIWREASPHEARRARKEGGDAF